MGKQSPRTSGTAQLTDSEVLHRCGSRERGAGGEWLERHRGEQTELRMFSRESHQGGSKASGLGLGGRRWCH